MPCVEGTAYGEKIRTKARGLALLHGTCHSGLDLPILGTRTSRPYLRPCSPVARSEGGAPCQSDLSPAHTA